MFFYFYCFHISKSLLFKLLNVLCFRYLIGQGANVGVVNSEGETPLDIAEEEAMEELLQNEINRQGESRRRTTFYLFNIFILVGLSVLENKGVRTKKYGNVHTLTLSAHWPTTNSLMQHRKCSSCVVTSHVTYPNLKSQVCLFLAWAFLK